jgi:hypothetical protein
VRELAGGASQEVVFLKVRGGSVDFFQVSSTVTAEFRRGDANGDGYVDVSDAVTTLLFLFTGQQRLTCRKAADANDDGELDLADAVGLCTLLFLGGQALPAPFPGCGIDPTADDLDCTAYAPCGGPD